MAVSSTSSTSNTLVDQYVDSYLQTQQYRFEPLDLKASQLENKQAFFTQLNSKLNTLLSAMDKFGTYKNVTTTNSDTGLDETTRQFVKVSNIDSKFQTRKITASQADFLSATANGTALTGMNNVKVLQLASSDTYIGKQATLSQTPELDESGNVVKDADGKDVMKGTLNDELKAGLVDGKGTVSFKIKIGDSEQAFNIEYSADDSTEDVMKRITQTVNKGKNEGGLGDTINAAFVKDTSGTARLTFTAKGTGQDNQIIFSDSNDMAENVFGIVNSGGDSEARNVYDDTNVNTFGYQKASASTLNAKINLNGVTVVRGSNSISDAIDGVTLTLKKAHLDSDIPTTLSTDVDTKAVETLINPLVEAFNGIANFIAVNKEAHGSDTSMIGLQNALRSITSEDLSSYAEEGYTYKGEETKPLKYLTELGFKISSDNVLTLSDPSKLEKILKSEDGPKLVADMINGFSARVSEYVDSLTARDKEQGLIKSRLSSISQQIETNNKKIQQVDDSIAKAADGIRKQYTSYLSAYYNAQSQYSLLAAMPSSSGSGYDSLLQQSTQMSNQGVS